MTILQTSGWKNNDEIHLDYAFSVHFLSDDLKYVLIMLIFLFIFLRDTYF